MTTAKHRALTEQGTTLINELMRRGMVIDIAHLPRWATLDTFALLDSKKYPAISTHGLNYEGRVYENGGFARSGFSTCGDIDGSDTMGQRFRDDTVAMQQGNGLPGQPFSLDLNGFAGSRSPRFGPDSGCQQPQKNPVTYPFTSFDGGITFTQPFIGNRALDFNTEGLLHVGMLPELIEDVRREGISDSDLEPLFHSAESFLQMWSRAEQLAD